MQQADDEQVQRVVKVKEPLNHAVDGGACAAAAIVPGQQGNGEHHAELEQTVYPVKRETVHHGVERHIKETPEDLLFGRVPVGADGEDA